MTLKTRARVAACALLVGSGMIGSLPHARAAVCDPNVPTSCTLREVADLAGLRFGATAEASETTDPQYSTTLATHFNSLTPENALKWYTTEPSNDAWNFGPGDAVVNFAVAHGMEVRGHTLVWAQDTYTPSWVTSITNSATMQAELDEHITAEVQHFADRVHRWDVVNEPLQSIGTGSSNSVYERLLGPSWIANAFTLTHSLDPSAELWLNEYGTDWVPGKHAALLALVTDLVNTGVPIDGVGIQTHRFPNSPIDRAAFESQLRDFADLGLDVAVTELDVPTSPTDSNAFATQAAQYAAIVDACLAVDRCREVTTWGVTDASTWLDTQGLFPTPTRPLMFDSNYQPKAAYNLVRDDVATYATGAMVDVGNASIVEGDSGSNRSLELNVTLTKPAARDFSLQYQLVGGSAAYPGDFTTSTGVWRTLKFAASNSKTPTVKYVKISVRPDQTAEGDEQFFVVVRSATNGYRLSTPLVLATIIDDDVNPAPRVSVGDTKVHEGDQAAKGGKNTAHVTVTLDRPLAATASVVVAVTGGTATGGIDFVSSTRTVTFAANQVAKLVNIPLVPDTNVEGDETVAITLSNPSGVGPGRTSGILTIVNDD